MLDLSHTLQITIDIAHAAGAVAMQHFNQPHEETIKKNIYDIVTEADKASEAVIASAIQQQFPTHHIVGEESGGMGAPADQADYFWYVDPIDGTSNYANNIPYFAVSIALAGRDRVPLVGVVFNPAQNELYAAARGQGAALNGQPIHVSQSENLARAILATGFPYGLQDGMVVNLKQWGDFTAYGVRGMRRFGSAAMDLAYVAGGRLDGFWEFTLNPWDCQAGILLVEEAGGRVSDLAGAHTDTLYNGTQVVASNGAIHDEMLGILLNGNG